MPFVTTRSVYEAEYMLCCLPGVRFRGAMSQSAVQDGTGNPSQAFLAQAWDRFKESLATGTTRQPRAWRKSRSLQSLMGQTGERGEDKCGEHSEFMF